MKYGLSLFSKLFVLFLILVFGAICLLFVPHFELYLQSFMAEKALPPLSPVVVYVTGALLCLPCVCVLLLSLGITDSIRKDSVFTAWTAKRLSLISLILFVTCVLFLAAITLLFFMGESVVAPLLALIDLIGFGLSVLLKILAGYIARAAILKEEVEATL